MEHLIKIYFQQSFVFVVGLLSFLLFSCHSSVDNSEVQKVINEAEWFSQSGLVIDSLISNDQVILKYNSVTEREFYKALLNTNYPVSYFTRDHSIGEKLRGQSTRNGDTLLVDLKSDSILLNTRNAHDTRYFYANKVGKYHMVKKLSFEEAITIFLSDECGTKIYDGVSATPNEQGKLLFLSSNEQEYEWDSTQVSLIKVNGCSMDTLISCNPHWFSLFSFFTDSNEIYLAYAVVNDDGSYTITPVRMEVQTQ
jgi:hypothetical protein